MVVNKVDKRIKARKDSVIKYQILTYCFFNDIQISKSDLDCLTELAKQPLSDLGKFCNYIAEIGIFKSSQSARNSLSKSLKKKLVVRTEDGKKKISINDQLKIQSEGVIFLDFKVVSDES